MKQKFLGEIYRNIQTFAFKVLQESSSCVSGNGAMQMFFVIPYRNMFAGKNIFGCVLQAYYFQFQEVRSVKWVRFFEGNCIIKWVIFFHWFLLALRFSATNYGIIKTLMMSTGTCGIKLYARNTIFKKRITNMRFWIIYILVQVSPALGRFSQCFFF